jgi:zinc and cadmium transporter
MFTPLLLSLYCLLVMAASLAGGALPSLFRITHTSLQVLMSGIGGFMLGVAVLHLLPHAFGELRSMDWAAGCMLVGMVAMFFMIRVFHVHQHVVMEPERHEQGHHHHEPHAAACDHSHHHPHAPDPCLHDNRFSWMGLALGLAIHTLIDGIALGAAVASGAAHDSWWLGVTESFAIFLAVALHKPLDSLSITTTMTAGGWSPRQRWLANLGFALMAPLGAALFYFGVAQSSSLQHLIVGSALAFAAGVFLCVSLADILPELSFHSHDRFTLSAALLLGVAAAYGIGFLEPPHVHTSSSANAAMGEPTSPAINKQALPGINAGPTSPSGAMGVNAPENFAIPLTASASRSRS